MKVTVFNSKSEGMPTIFIHGALGDGSEWLLVVQELRKTKMDSPMHLLDLPGHGASEEEAAHSVEEYAKAVADYIAQNIGKPCLLVGHSMGGAISQMMALEHSSLTAGLVLVATGPKLLVAPEFLAMLPDRFQESIAFFRPAAFGPDTPELLVQMGVEVMAKCKPITAYWDFTSCDQFDVIQRLPEIKAPTIVLTGELDVLTPVRLGSKLKAIPGSEMRIINDMGHMLPIENPTAVSSAIVEAFGKL